MRYLLVAFLILVPGLQIQAQSEKLDQARERLLHGNYAEAISQFQKLIKAKDGGSKAAIGLSRAYRRVGKYEDALSALDEGLRAHPKSADLLAEKADLLLFRGRWEEAAKNAQAALDKNDNHYLAHYALARLYQNQGEMRKAAKELVWFIRAYANNDIPDMENLCLVGLAAVERARWDARLADQFQFVLTEIWRFAAKEDDDYWWAEYYTGELLREKYNNAGAHGAFTRALKINPRAAEVIASKGMMALERYQMGEADLYVKQALKINPKLPDALRLKADIFLTAGDTSKAMEYLEKAKAINPRSEETLARIGSCLFLDGKKEKLEEHIRKVQKQNPRAGLFFQELAERLDQRKRYYDAERYYKLAIKLRPGYVSSRNNLGLLYMRLGKEAEAKEVLEDAFESDSFNIRVYNTLKVLDHLETYSTLKTKHFEIRYDKKNDPTLARFVAKYLENIYEELAAEFQYRPKGPILIELFNKHEMFSGRVIALPDLHTIGACTGKMVAMVSPYEKSGVIAKPFNWNRVLRHELVHIFNLEQTRFMVPHWFTEGLAVRAEEIPHPPMWNRLLLERVDNKKLLDLDNIHLGFIRPRSQDEWQLAYLQSKLYVDYLIKTHGLKAIGEFLEVYRQGKNTRAALKKVCNLSQEEFEKGYLNFLKETAENLSGKAPEKRLTFSELKAANQKDPNNADIAARLGEQYLNLGNIKKARTLADKALGNNQQHPLASYVKARLLLQDGDLPRAKKQLQKGIDRKSPNVKVVKMLGTLLFKEKKYSDAADLFELGRKAEPYENYWLLQLGRCYRQNGEDEKLIGVLKEYVPTDSDDPSSRRLLAKLLSKAGNHREAEKYAREVLEIDVLDDVARETLTESLKAQNKEQELQELNKLFGE